MSDDLKVAIVVVLGVVGVVASIATGIVVDTKIKADCGYNYTHTYTTTYGSEGNKK